MKLPLALQSYPITSVRENPQRLINMYEVNDKAEGKSSNILYPTPGLKLFVDTNGNAVRGLITLHGIAYIVKDNKFGSITSAGVYTDIGTLNTSSGAVCITSTNTQILIVDGSKGYLYTVSGSIFTAITDVNFPASCTYVASQDDYFFALNPNSDTFYLSNLADGSTWPALNFASANVRPDNLVAAISAWQQMWLIGENTTEIWFDTGADFPFQPQQGTMLNYGCGAPASLTLANDSLIWLAQTQDGQGFVVSAFNPTAPKIVSNDAIHLEFNSYTRLSDAFAYTYMQAGHEFYVITFPTDNKTWVYDITTDMWHQRNSVNTTAITQPNYTRHRGNCYTFLAGMHLVGDFISGKVFQLDLNTLVDDTIYQISRTIITPNLSNNGRLFTIYSLELFVEPGQGIQTGQGSSPTVMLEVSRDGGFTWGNIRTSIIGAIGSYRKRVKWNMLGIARDFAFRFTFTDPVKFIVIGAEIDAEKELEPWPQPVDYRHPR